MNLESTTPDPGISKSMEVLKLPEISDTGEMIEVYQNTWGITQGSRQNPFLKTIGLGPCVAVVLYDPKTQIAGLSHMIASFATDNDRWKRPHNDLLNMVSAMQRNGVTYDNRFLLQAYLVGGGADDLPIIVQERLKQLGINDIITNIRSKDNESHSIAFDSRNGHLYELVNIIPGEINRFDELQALMPKEDGSDCTSDVRSLK